MLIMAGGCDKCGRCRHGWSGFYGSGVVWAGWDGQRLVSAGCGELVEVTDCGERESSPGVVLCEVQPGLAGGTGEVAGMLNSR